MEIVRVDKPWGWEIRWVRTDRFAGKILHIRAGHQLSLQYHERKDEAFYVRSGTLDLVLGRGADQQVVRLGPGTSRHVPPGTVHRFRAVTDCELFEVSTPELEDVVRLEDDFGREGTSDAPRS
jgi:mannose-6-phosphate isomerase-like protein (cupin superfamily)